MTEDEMLQALYRECEEMEKRDKTGMSLVEIMVPWQNLQNFLTAQLYRYTMEQQNKTDE